MRYLLLFLVLVLGANAGAQSSPASGGGKFYLALSPAKLADPLHRGALYALGANVSDRWAVEVGHLYLFTDQHNRSGRRSVERGHRLHLSAVRFFAVPPNSVLRPYFALRTDYLWADYTYLYLENEVADAVSTLLLATPPPESPSAQLHGRVFTVNALAGVRVRALSFLDVDLQFGYGVRYRDNRLREPSSISHAAAPPWFGHDWTFNIPIDARFLLSF